MNKKEIGVYIHIPFCKQKCYYCDFTSFANCNQYVEKYVEQLKNEIIKQNLSQYKISTIYIGGGTPSHIDSSYIVEILKLINVKEAKEVTIEVNPGTVTKKKLKDYYNAGINRISIGLQSANDKLLKTIGRIHNFEEFIKTYNLAREVGFKNVNVDLMIGLPNQDLQDIEETICKITKLEPEHISVYSLIVEENTKIEQLLNEGILEEIPEETERKMYWLVKNKLENLGYKHYEISNFAKEGYESKHNMDCWNQKEYIGFGLAAHSYLNKKRYSNTENLKTYLEDVEKNRIIHEVQTTESERNEYMLLGLRKIDGINIQDFKNKFVDNPIYLYREELNKLVMDKLVNVDENYIKLTNKGIDLANLVWEEFV